MSTFEKPLKVTKTDTYTFTVPQLWLGTATITAHTVTVDSLVTKNSSSVSDNVIGVSLTGITEGNSSALFDYTLSDGRTDCDSITLKVIADC